ncbi:MAG: TRAP transporter small permease subunit [Desulfarculaceae bacterium]|jgi:TRAP-type C4-dicarboxylate transport system permease small subunit
MERARTILVRILELVVGACFMIITAVTFAQVFCRYALSFSLSWSHELTVLIFIWVIWLCVPIGLERKGHLAVTIVLEHLPDRLQVKTAWINLGLSLFFFVLVFVLIFPVIDAFEGMSLLTLPVSISARYYAAAAGSGLAILVLVAQLLSSREKA